MTDTRKATTHRSAPRKRTIRLAKEVAARDAIGTLERGCELFILTFGQFSLIDILGALLEQTGPAHVTISTWTAGIRDTAKAAWFVEQAKVLSMRFLVDRSFLTRQPAYCAAMRRHFGDACIRTTRTHAKFMTLRTDEWTLALRTSMNLNENEQLENLEISDDPALCQFLESVADEIFAAQGDGVMDGELPLLDRIPPVPTPDNVNGVRVGHATGRRIWGER